MLLANTPTQPETLPHSLERAAASIGLHVNAEKMEYMCFNQRGNIYTLNGSSLKQVDKFTYLRRSVSSTETDINTQLAKALTAIERLSAMWKSDLTDKIKQSFFQAAIIWMHYSDTIWMYGEKAWQQLHYNAVSNIEQILEAAPNKAAVVRPPTTHHENYPS